MEEGEEGEVEGREEGEVEGWEEGMRECGGVSVESASTSWSWPGPALWRPAQALSGRAGCETAVEQLPAMCPQWSGRSQS